jgi:phosphodiesterase/alkaline phosphatase D-like protein
LKTEDIPALGSFTSYISGLYTGVSYFVRAYATNSAGTSYGSTRSFTASGQSPTATIAAATDITATSATLKGNVTSNSSITTITFQYGTSTSYTSTVTADQSPLPEDESSEVSANITGLTASTIYHYRIVATNAIGTSFSADITFTTTASKSQK